VEPGEFLTFLGPSGSGKTTTLMMIAGFTIPTSGDIVLDSASVVALPPYQREIGMVFQNYALFPHMSVAKNVAFPLEMRKRPAAEIASRVSEALKMVHLESYAERKPKELSGGQQQRVALARSLVFRPPILLLDEPFGALDAKLREEMKYEISQLHRHIGVTVLFVTHDQQEALTLSDRIAIFHQGSISQVGTPQDLYSRPTNRFVAGFMGKGNILEGEVINRGPESFRLRLKNKLEVTVARRQGFPDPHRFATVLVRTEDIRFGASVRDAINRFRGDVSAIFYAGSNTEVVVRLESQMLVSMTVPTARLQAAFRVDDPIEIGWDLSDALLVESDGK
jgi:spermidine/putrescine ABC transporter ATP-binding subunit